MNLTGLTFNTADVFAVAALVLAGSPWFLYPLALVSAAGILGVLTMVYIIVLLILFRRDNLILHEPNLGMFYAYDETTGLWKPKTESRVVVGRDHGALRIRNGQAVVPLEQRRALSQKGGGGLAVAGAYRVRSGKLREQVHGEFPVVGDLTRS